jgi:hypothetical protein
MARLLTFLTSARPAAVDIAQLYASNQKESITLDQIWIKGALLGYAGRPGCIGCNLHLQLDFA